MSSGVHWVSECFVCLSLDALASGSPLQLLVPEVKSCVQFGGDLMMNCFLIKNVE